MPETKIGSTDISNMSNVVTDFSVKRQSTDGIFDQPETTWMNANWTQYFGYYRTIPELKAVIDAKATWTVGKGFIADEITTMLLDSVIGWGKDTFNTIIENMIRTYNIGGDAFCEIVRDEDDVLINLKALDPEVMVIIVNSKGMVKRYEQNSKVNGVPPKKFRHR